VPVEGQLLPSEELKPLYEKVIWLWVYRSFKKDPGDLAAERVMNRCGASTYPQLLFIDGPSWTVLVECGRSVAEFIKSAENAIARMKKPDPAVERLLVKMNRAKTLLEGGKKDDAAAILSEFKKNDPCEFFAEARELLGLVKPASEEDLADPDADRRADALDLCLAKRVPITKGAMALLSDPDGDVRLRAVAYVAAVAPDRLDFKTLLADPMDGVKFAVLDAGKSAPDPKLAKAGVDAWRDLDAGKIRSGNPNVLRMKLAEILGLSGGEDAVPILEAFASRHEFLNGTTGACVRSLGQLGKRKVKGAAASLINCFPPAVTPEMEKAKHATHCINLARTVHAALQDACGESPSPFPPAWKEDDRKQILEAWTRHVK